MATPALHVSQYSASLCVCVRSRTFCSALNVTVTTIEHHQQQHAEIAVGCVASATRNTDSHPRCPNLHQTHTVNDLSDNTVAHTANDNAGFLAAGARAVPPRADNDAGLHLGPGLSGHLHLPGEGGEERRRIGHATSRGHQEGAAGRCGVRARRQLPKRRAGQAEDEIRCAEGVGALLATAQVGVMKTGSRWRGEKPPIFVKVLTGLFIFAGETKELP